MMGVTLLDELSEFFHRFESELRALNRAARSCQRIENLH